MVGQVQVFICVNLLQDLLMTSSSLRPPAHASATTSTYWPVNPSPVLGRNMPTSHCEGEQRLPMLGDVLNTNSGSLVNGGLFGN